MKTSAPACLVLTKSNEWRNHEGNRRVTLDFTFYALDNDGTPRNGYGTEFHVANIEITFYEEGGSSSIDVNTLSRTFGGSLSMKAAAKFLAAVERKVTLIRDQRGTTEAYKAALICGALKVPLLIPAGLKTPLTLTDKVWEMYTGVGDILEALHDLRAKLFSKGA